MNTVPARPVIEEVTSPVEDEYEVSKQAVRPVIEEVASPAEDEQEESKQLQSQIDDVKILDSPPSPVRPFQADADQKPSSHADKMNRIDELEKQMADLEAQFEE